MTLEEKALLLTGAGKMLTKAIERLHIPAKRMADGPHGVRSIDGKHCTAFPNLCSLGATWDMNAAEDMGEALASECHENGISLLLAPGINIKRHILCGRNFEYLSEDPVLSGELAVAYINGLQNNGVSASLKHFACNNQEENRTMVSVDVDERTLREIYLKGFEIAVKKSKPDSIMCAYNKVHSIWCSENKQLLQDILKDEWGYEGFVISDWGAVHDIAKSLAAGLDYQMPQNQDILQQIETALQNKTLTIEDVDNAVERVLCFILKEKTIENGKHFDREKQHKIARELAAQGIVLLKNHKEVLPIQENKYTEIAVIGEFAEHPLISGQGSAEVAVQEEYIDSPLEELQKALGDSIKIKYRETYRVGEYSPNMLWPTLKDYKAFIESSDLVILFVGSMLSEDTEKFDRRTACFNPNYEMFIEAACDCGKKVVVVMQTGSAMILGKWHTKADAIVEMWLAGEGAGKAIADVLTGKVNPSGKLPETFPTKLRTDMEYPGNDWYVEYNEKEEVGYRYYDRHPEEICYPFGHGLSYSNFVYSDFRAEVNEHEVLITFKLANTSAVDGSEVVQIYVGKTTATVRRPIKELKAFKKVFVKAGTTVEQQIVLNIEDLSYYNTMLKQWIVESGEYSIYIAASSRDIRLKEKVVIKGNQPYTILPCGEDMIG